MVCTDQIEVYENVHHSRQHTRNAGKALQNLAEQRVVNVENNIQAMVKQWKDDDDKIKKGFTTRIEYAKSKKAQVMA